MDQVKIGKFIAESRKARHMTQAQLAEQLGVTDRAVSKWETGRSMPDTSIMLDLCGLLGITVNELLTGEHIEMEQYDKMAEENLLAMRRREEEKNRKLLRLEIVVGVLSTVAMVTMVAVGQYAVADPVPRWVLTGVGLGLFLVGIFAAMFLERTTGYFRCAKCGKTHVPSWASHTFAAHTGMTRYMRCPHCHRWSWQKKVMSPEGE